jgi:uncharacterized protein YlzI (FlbEa/FlbD family)
MPRCQVVTVDCANDKRWVVSSRADVFANMIDRVKESHRTMVYAKMSNGRDMWFNVDNIVAVCELPDGDGHDDQP